MSQHQSVGQIVALGGGGFSDEGAGSPLDELILSLSPRQPARVCFVPTASADSAAYLVRFYRAFSARAIATDLTLFASPAVPRRPASTEDLAEFVGQQDIFYVGGGNTAHLLAVWRLHGLDQLLRDAWSRGAILCGVSAGMLCWFRAGVTDSFGPLAGLHDGLALIDAAACPHYDNERDRRATFHRLIAEGMPAGYAADDGVALHFRGTELVEAVSSRVGASAYYVALRDGSVHEERIEARLL